MQTPSLLPLDNKQIDHAFQILKELSNQKKADELKKEIQGYEKRISNTYEALQKRQLSSSPELMDSLNDLTSFIRLLSICKEIRPNISIYDLLAEVCWSYLSSLDINEQHLIVSLQENKHLAINFSNQKTYDVLISNLRRLAVHVVGEKCSANDTNAAKPSSYPFKLSIHKEDIENFLFIFFKDSYKDAYSKIDAKELIDDEAINAHHDSANRLATSNTYDDFFPARESVTPSGDSHFTNNKPVFPTSKISSNSSNSKSLTEEQKKLWDDIWNREGGVDQAELVERLSQLKL